MKKILMLLLAASTLWACSKDSVTSPQGDISVKMSDNTMVISYKGTPVQTVNIRAGELVSSSKQSHIEESYDMLIGKRLHCSNSANAVTFKYDACSIEVRAYNDGVTYRFIGTHPETSYIIPHGTNRWMLEEKQDYEGLYLKSSSAKEGVLYYPSLVEAGDGVFELITEAGIYRGQCGSHLVNAGDDIYKVTAADEQFPEGTSPWRVVILGELSTIVESTLVTDVSEPCKLEDTSWIKPGVSAWIYWSSNGGSADYQQVVSFIDLAAEMHWPYNLIDGGWDRMSNGGSPEDAIAYAASKGIKTNVWYNSGKLFGRSVMTDPETREAELSRIEALGVTGIKVDFFKDDSSESMEFYLDILDAAVKHHLLVDFHGCTLPRGWERTYPNLMTYEAVRGAEWYNNGPEFTDAAATHNATLPFTRNVVGPMDYTAGTFSDSQHPHITTWGHELALPVLFESGLCHMPDRPSAYYALAPEVKDLLSNLPNTWDETKLLSGYPGDHVVIARRKGAKWYVAGINGTANEGELKFDITKLGLSSCKATLFVDGEDGKSIECGTSEDMYQAIECLPMGGFVAVIE